MIWLKLYCIILIFMFAPLSFLLFLFCTDPCQHYTDAEDNFLGTSAIQICPFTVTRRFRCVLMCYFGSFCVC